jgi:transcriptional regulator with XRE-family HTH domain
MLPNRIPLYRKRAGLSQTELAERVGTSRNMVAKLESTSRRLTSDWLVRIGDALDVPPYLLIAPDDILPSEQELADMLNAAQQTLPVGLPYSEWPKAVAAGLHIRLRTLLNDRANTDNADH